MVNHNALRLALRARARALVVCTTGVTTLAATAVGYTRAAGSFLADGFYPGMELAPVGFVDTTRAVVRDVAAQLLTIDGGRTAEAADTGRSLAVGLPELVRWSGRRLATSAGRPYVEEELVPGTAQQITLTGSAGQTEHTGLYLLRWYGLAGAGDEAINAALDALLVCYPPSSADVLPNGDVCRIRSDNAPYRSAIADADPGWAVATLTVPYRVTTTNPS